jgi:hypothetical protein
VKKLVSGYEMAIKAAQAANRQAHSESAKP